MLRLKSWTQPTQPFCLTEARYPRSAVYRSAAVYFQAILGYQARHLHVAVEPIHRSAIKDAVRSIRRGLGPAGLKDSFDVSYLSNITHQEQPEPFSVENPVHMLDVVVLGLWFMLREAEIAAARLAHLTIDSNTVSLLVPVHKTDQVGSLSMRQLNCACRYPRHHLWCLMRLAWHLASTRWSNTSVWCFRRLALPWLALMTRGTPSSLQWARFDGQTRQVATGALLSTFKPFWDTRLDTYMWQWSLSIGPPSRTQCGAFAEALDQLVWKIASTSPTSATSPTRNNQNLSLSRTRCTCWMWSSWDFGSCSGRRR